MSIKTAALGVALLLIMMGQGAALVMAAPALKGGRDAVRGARQEARQEFREEAKEARQELKQERWGLFEEVREKISSLPGMLRSAFARRAVIVSGTVSAKADTTLTVEKDGTSYTVLTGEFDRCTTRFRRRFWGVSSLAEVSLGDTVNAFGFWQDEGKTTIQACLIRDLSVQKRLGVFVGVVLSLTGSGWVMDPVGDRPNQTVTVGSATRFVNRKNEAITQTDIKVGHRVRVKGLWNMANNTVTEVIHVKDYSLPPLPTGGPEATPTATVAPTP